MTHLLAVPMTVQAEENGTDMVLAAKSVAGEFKTALQEAAHKTIKFANQDGINIYKEPSTGAVVLDQAFLNTSFEVLGEYGDWSMITTEAGHAYIETKYLSGIEIRRPSYSEEDLYILAHVICGEAQNCPDDEQLLVGSSGVEPGEPWPVSQHHQRRGICTGAVLRHQRRKLLP